MFVDIANNAMQVVDKAMEGDIVLCEGDCFVPPQCSLLNIPLVKQMCVCLPFLKVVSIINVKKV